MSGVLVITAVDVEAHGLGRRLGLARRRDTGGLHYGGAVVEVVCAGPRALHLDRLEDLARAASLVVSAGICGALAPHLRAGDLVIPDVVLTLSGARYALAKARGLSQVGALLSVDRVVETAESKARLWRDTAALALDMESAAIVEWAAALGRDAIAVRGVSDAAIHGVPAALADVVDGDGRTRPGRLVRSVLRRPRMLLRVVTLGRDTAAALRAVAGGLRVLLAASASAGQAGTAPPATRPEGVETLGRAMASRDRRP